jgi:protein-disulfide isomerase
MLEWQCDGGVRMKLGFLRTCRPAGWTGPAGAILFLATTLSISGQTGMHRPGEFFVGGEPGAPIKIEVFSDYQCPACRTFYLETIKPILANYASAKTGPDGQPIKPRVCIVYHDLPLDIHQFARPAARLSLAAQRLGRERWLRVSDALYTHQAQWSQDGNLDAALAKVLDPTEVIRLRKLAADPAINAMVDQELMLAQSRDITSTPTFFIITETGRQQRINGPVPYAVMKDFLDRLLK